MSEESDKISDQRVNREIINETDLENALNTTKEACKIFFQDFYVKVKDNDNIGIALEDIMDKPVISDKELSNHSSNEEE